MSLDASHAFPTLSPTPSLTPNPTQTKEPAELTGALQPSHHYAPSFCTEAPSVPQVFQWVRDQERATVLSYSHHLI